jgi:hypothetical protein
MGASPRELGGEIEGYDTEPPDPTRPPKYSPAWYSENPVQPTQSRRYWCRPAWEQPEQPPELRKRIVAMRSQGTPSSR